MIGAFGGACGGTAVRPAPFRARPDSVQAGDLRGPFEGRVLDGETGRPVSGALVHATWSFVAGVGLTAPAGWREWVGSTDAAGRYRIPALDDYPGGGSRLGDFRVVIYKRGYVAYRSDRRFEDLGPRTDFSQDRNEVRLERWSSDLSHAKHLRYVGGGVTLAELTAWEIPEAARELSERGGAAPKRAAAEAAPPAPSGPPLVAETLLQPEDVARVTGWRQGFEVRDLGDEPSTPEYDSVHLQAPGEDQSFDVALRFWHVRAAEAADHYARVKAELPNVRETDEIADKSLRAATAKGDILGVAFLDAKRGVVALLQCGASQCKRHEDVVKLARLVADRAQEQYPEAKP